MQKDAFFTRYFCALQSKAPNNYRIATLLLLAIAMSVTIVESVTTPVRLVSGFVTLAILFLLGAAAQP